MKKALTNLGKVLMALFLTTAFIIVLAGMLAKLTGEERLQNNMLRNQAFYISMRDNVKIAVDLWLPETLNPGNKIPTLLHMTRYWRATETSFLKRALIGLGLLSSETILPRDVAEFNRAGYAVMLVDARGSGASFGSRVAELAPDEIADYGEIVDWVVAQNWSNGRVGAYGTSYNGITAERLAGTGRAAVKAVAPLYADFDFQLGVLQPGGATLDFIDLWSTMVTALDSNDICVANSLETWQCLLTRLLTPGVKPVDGDGGKLLAQAVAAHRQNLPLAQAFAEVEYRDDHYGDTQFSIAELNSYSHRDAIEQNQTPMQVWLGWLDAATVEGGLSRYLTFANPQEVIIGPFSHGGAHDTDPFQPAAKPVTPTVEQQYQYITAFFDRFLKAEHDRPKKHITYYTLGAGHWCRTASWPPSGMYNSTFYFSDAGGLATVPTASPSVSEIEVDSTHSTGRQNRWFTNLDYGDVIYAEHNHENAKLLTFTSEPLKQAITITGSTLLTLHVASNQPDVVFHAYLETVAPDGTLHHLAEGVLRSTNHPLAEQHAPSQLLSPPRSFTRADAAPLQPNQISGITFALTPVSARIPAGYQLRLALAGADRSIFPVPSQSEPIQWRVYHGGKFLSQVTLPLEGPNSCLRVTPF